MARKNSKRKNIDKEVCPVPKKSNKAEKSDAYLRGRIAYSSDVNKLLSTQMLVLVKGPICSGKTQCAREVADARNLPIKYFQINDDLDSKTVFGSYSCTDIPGEFVWQPSILSKCLKERCLIVLKAFDTAHVDLVAAIFALAETRHYKLQGEGICKMNEECRIIATMGSESSLNLIRDYPYAVDLIPLTSEEHSEILTMRFPQLDVIKEKVLSVFSNVCAEMKSSSYRSNRQLFSSDLFRFCKRLCSFANFSDNVLLLHEFLDVWVMHLAIPEQRMKVAQIVAQELSINEQQLSFVLNMRKPEIELETNVVFIGRASMRRQLKQTMLRQSRSYGLTRVCSQLIERIMICVSDDKRREAVLLSGETGVGKTSMIQLLSSYVGIPLKTVNMSQDSEYSDLIGGYKPVSLSNVVRSLADDYLRLFREKFNVDRNQKFLDHVNNCLLADDFETFLHLVTGSVTNSVNSKETSDSMKEWQEVGERAIRLIKCFDRENRLPAVPFAYVQGILSEAAEKGYWLLIDEINLASPECLDAIVQVLNEATNVHSNFRLFACMNPATDVGKKELPSSVRSKFTEFYVQDTSDTEELAIIVKNYLKEVDATTLKSILEFYQEVCVELPRKYSLRTLCRALSLIAGDAHGGPLRTLVGGLAISFTSNLNAEEQIKLSSIISKHFAKVPDHKSTNKSRNCQLNSHVLVEGFYIRKGDANIIKDSRYIFTPSVKANLAFLASVVATGRFPILLEGETSSGKTSIIQHLAKISGNRIYRINNHEHIDVQEYLGNYAPNREGRLEFMEGVLLKAVRKGDWIILDELNLAPPAVLEALNRLLDDNREIFVPELNIAVPAHPRFQLFATQNPVGSYAGRKRLSRAFLNRFVIIKYEHLPFHELPQIVQYRCGVSLSIAEKMVEVLGALKARRSVSGIFSFANGLMTLRDLFRWGNRVAMTKEDSCCYDWRQVLADQGFFVLGSRCRCAEDEQTVLEVLEKHLKRNIDVKALFSCQSKYFPKEVLKWCHSSHFVLNYSMCRMLILVSEAWKCNEAVLLVGHTGCGKTTAAHILDESLISINCNERTETSDFLGNIRPTSDGLFQWCDGVVLKAMKGGMKLLIDEISLAPDSVLERLNSLLEPERSILPMDGANSDLVKASDGFQILATMNPGDDYGKKELSKALRNRFLEVWCSAEHSVSNTRLLIEKRIFPISLPCELVQRVANCLVQFLDFFTKTYGHLFRNPLTIRDLICIAELFRNCISAKLSIGESILHAISANLFDAFGLVPTRMSFDRSAVTESCLLELFTILKNCGFDDYEHENIEVPQKIIWAESGLQVGCFSVSCGQQLPDTCETFSFDAPTSKKNAFRVARALVSSKPVMLEGSPGAGKSSLIVALAKVTGNVLVRINLSEQTDLCDLFGSDVPVVAKDGKTSFAWKDGPILAAIKENSWILLDEMNLAPQPVLEGLNSCFDFRKNLFVPQLNKTFEIEKTKCRFFACQNPRSQGGDRKALPKSFLNRFTSIYVEEMSSIDFVFVLQRHCGEFLSQKTIENMVGVNEAVSDLKIKEGGPFEFNLRDLLRWAYATKEFDVRFGFEIVYLRRLRGNEDVRKTRQIFDRIFGIDVQFFSALPLPVACDKFVRFGATQLDFIPSKSPEEKTVSVKSFYLLASQCKVLQQLVACVHLDWLCLLTGDCNSGKRSVVEVLAKLSDRPLCLMRLTAETDAMELLGSYEQVSTPTSNGACNMQFKWQNSEFVDAYVFGKWILIEDVNSCSPAVLDCLNSCLEDGGHLVVPGHSVDKSNRIEKNPGFRAFFTMDPKNGNLSRAMRNRCVELFMTEELQWNRNLSDAVSVVFHKSQTSFNDTGKGDANWITNLSASELLRCSAMACASDLNTDPSIPSNPSSARLMVVARPMLGQNLRSTLGACLSTYYWHCWEEVARISDEPIPAFVFALLSSPSEKRQGFCKLDESLMGMVEKYVQDAVFSSGSSEEFNIQSFFEISSSSNNFSLDLLYLLRTVRKTAISQRFLKMFPSDMSKLIQEHFSDVMKQYRIVGPYSSSLIASSRPLVPQPVYSSTIRSLNGSGPFVSLQDYKLFYHNAVSPSTSDEVLPVQHGNSTLSLIADFEEFVEALSILCHRKKFTSLDLRAHRLAAFQKYVPWKSEEAYETFAALEILNAPCDFHSLLKTNFSDFLSLQSFQAVIANKFWSFYGFSSHSLTMPLNKLHETGALLSDLTSAFWTLTFLRNDIELRKKVRLADLGNCFCTAKCLVDDVRAIPPLVEFIKTSLILLKTVTPPLGVADPVIAEQVQHDYWKESLNFVEAYFSSLKSFLLLTLGACDEVFLEQKENAVLRILHDAKKETLTSLAKLSDACDESTFYRLSFEKFHELVHLLDSFTKNVTTTLSSLLDQNLLALSGFCSGARNFPSSFAMLPAQLSVFLKTCESFKQQMVNNFFSFVDVSTMYISVLNVLLLGVSRVLLMVNSEFRNRQMVAKQKSFKISLDMRGLFTGSEIIRWVISASSSLPPQLQLESVLCHIQHSSDIPSDLLQWIESKWCLWYQKNSEKKDSLYVFKARKNEDDEDNLQEITDLEESELRQYIPDFSDIDLDNSINSGLVFSDSSELSGNQIMAILRSLFEPPSSNQQHEHEKISYHSLMKIVDDLQCYEAMEADAKLFDYFHLIYLRKAANILEDGETKLTADVLNVYSQGDKREFLRAIGAIVGLRNRVMELHDEFPENFVLLELLDKIHSFNNVSANAPLMKVAVLLEKVLTQANEWQQLADLSRSIQPQMLTLQEILLDWRKMEVLCWSHIIKNMESDFEENAVLSSWPIFEALNKLPSLVGDTELLRNDDKIVLMLIQWVHGSSLVDFSARLKSAELLVRFVTLKSERRIGDTNKFSSNLVLRIYAVIRYFKTFSGLFQEKLSKVKADTKQQLKNFVDIFKYNDLNFWNIRLSTQKARAQLFKIIKLFKESCCEPIEYFLLDELPQLPVLPTIDGIVFPQLSTSSKFMIVAKELECIFSGAMDYNGLDRLRNDADSFLLLLNQSVSYDGFDDETKEKLQGRALFERQKNFAFLVRSAAQIGLSSRRSLQINSENLTTDAVTNLFVDENDVGQMVRFSVVARNVFLKKFAAAKVNKQDHLQKQVPVHVLTHLKGITEFGLHWMVSAVQLLVEKIFKQSKSFYELTEGFKMVMDNFECSLDFDNQVAVEVHAQNSVDLKLISYWTDVLMQVVVCCPDGRSSSSFSGQLNELADEIASNPLATITKQSGEYGKLTEAIGSIEQSLKKLNTSHDDCRPKRFGLSAGKKVDEYKQVCLEELFKISQVLPIVSQYFPCECEKIGGICVSWISRMQSFSFLRRDQPFKHFAEGKVTAVLLRVQQLLKTLSLVVGKNIVNKLKSMDAVKEIVQLFYRLDFENARLELTQFLVQISGSEIRTSYEAIKIAYELSNDLHAIMEMATGCFSIYIKLFSSCYIIFEAIGCRILTDGFVNPIPKFQEGLSENSNGKNGTTESCCGIGEGTGGEEDVSNQIENYGQIEGVKGDKSDEQNELRNEAPTDEKQPIELEDDFAANLEDIDAEIDDDGNEQGEGDFENQVDWDKGQVEEADEQQFDPKLWEKPAIDEPKDTEQPQDDRRFDGDPNVETNVDNEENLAEDAALQEGTAEKTKGFDDDPDDDVDNTGEKGFKLPDEEESMEISSDSATQNEELVKDVDEIDDVNDGAETDSCEGNLDETDDHPVDRTQDSSIPDVQKDSDVLQDADDRAFGMDGGTGQDQSEKSGSEDKKLGEVKPEGTETGECNENLGLFHNSKNTDKDPLHQKDDQQSTVQRLVSEETASKVEDDNVLEDGEKDDQGEALGHQQVVTELDRYVLQNSSIEEATKTRDLFQRRPKQRTVDAATTKQSEGPALSVQENQPLSFPRHLGLSGNTVNIAFTTPYELDTSAAQISRLQEKFKELNALRDGSLELKWSLISESVSTLSSTLAENLRMIIEPNTASRLQGDYRTGKRLNVRRLIAYIASDYRKDRIWMRRTKKVKRNYQICIAVDDSASMKDNLMTEITCHGLCLIEKAFRQLEVGQLSVCKFGKDVKVIANFSSETESLDGAKLLGELTFKQDKTDLANLLAVTGDHFLQARQDFHACDQMLIILSDGRGVMSDGLDKIRAALSRLVYGEITVLFLIIDNGEKSIMDVKVAKFTEDGRVLFESYMDKFPFPFFAIVNDLSMLPSTIAEAIRQWFEFTCQ